MVLQEHLVYQVQLDPQGLYKGENGLPGLMAPLVHRESQDQGETLVGHQGHMVHLVPKGTLGTKDRKETLEQLDQRECQDHQVNGTRGSTGTSGTIWSHREYRTERRCWRERSDWSRDCEAFLVQTDKWEAVLKEIRGSKEHNGLREHLVVKELLEQLVHLGHRD